MAGWAGLEAMLNTPQNKEQHMEIEYVTINTRHNSEIVNRDDIEMWLTFNLNNGGIEERVSKLRKLMAVIGAQWLTANPQQVGDVAAAVNCYGRRHRLVDNE